MPTGQLQTCKNKAKSQIINNSLLRLWEEKLRSQLCCTDQVIAWSIQQSLSLQFSHKDRMFEVNKLLRIPGILWLFYLYLILNSRLLSGVTLNHCLIVITCIMLRAKWWLLQSKLSKVCRFWAGCVQSYCGVLWWWR